VSTIKKVSSSASLSLKGIKKKKKKGFWVFGGKVFDENAKKKTQMFRSLLCLLLKHGTKKKFTNSFPVGAF
jgi:hypothetical protein